MIKRHSIIILTFCLLSQFTLVIQANTKVQAVDSVKNKKEYETNIVLNTVEDSLFLKYQNQSQIHLPSIIELKKLGSSNISKRLQKLFKDTNSLVAKENLAYTLVFCGDQDSVYQIFLMERLSEVAKAKMPSPYGLDSKCQLTHQINPEFKSWCKKNNLDSVSAIKVFRNYVFRVIMFSRLGDARFSELFLKIGMSNNPTIMLVAFDGLAIINDTNFVAPIINAIRKQPDCIKALLSTPLIYFNTEAALVEAKRNLSRESFESSYKDFKENGLKKVYGF